MGSPNCTLRRLEQPRNLDPIQALMHVFGGGKIAHRGLERLMTHPMLYRSHVKAGSEHPRGIGGAEFPEIEVCRIEACSLCHIFTPVEHVELAVATR